jgi:16S rRNA (cytosine967-C5)-methyltransferase
VSVRELALQVLAGVQSRAAFSDKLIESVAAKHPLERRDRALLDELVRGTLKRRGTLDAVLERHVHLGLDRLPPWIQNALRLGAYQLLFLDRVPAHAAVSESVALAKKYGHPGTAGLVNSVLRRLAERPRDEVLAEIGVETEEVNALAALAARTSHPEWLLERWQQRFSPADLLALTEADNRAVRTALRANRLRLDVRELIQRLQNDGVAAAPGRFSPSTVWIEGDASIAELAVLARGDATVQDESETLVGLLLAPRPGERVLDLCAAPGGKTSHLAELMGDRGEVIAVELHEARARALRRTIERLHLKSVRVVEGDATTMDLGHPYDRVLVDAPCSGLGVLARRADARWRKKPELLAKMPSIQRALLDAGARAVRPGGVLVYSVCTFEPEETHDLVRGFLADHPQFRVGDGRSFLPDEVVTKDGFMLTLPHVHGTDGAFAVRLERAEASGAAGTARIE